MTNGPCSYIDRTEHLVCFAVSFLRMAKPTKNNNTISFEQPKVDSSMRPVGAVLHAFRKLSISHSRLSLRSSESYTKTVTTHTASEDFPFTRWEDATTAVLSGADSVSLTKLHLSRELGFLTDVAEQRLLAAYNFFCAANCSDAYQSYNKELLIAGFKERILCLRNVDEVPCWVGSGWYWIATLLLLNVPYRQFLDWNTGVVRHTIAKKIA